MLCIGRPTNQLILILGITVTTVIIIYKIDQKFKILKPKIDEWNTIMTKTTMTNTNLLEVHPSVQTTSTEQSLTQQLKTVMYSIQETFFIILKQEQNVIEN